MDKNGKKKHLEMLSLHGATEPAVREAVKTELSYRKDAMIVVIVAASKPLRQL